MKGMFSSALLAVLIAYFLVSQQSAGEASSAEMSIKKWAALQQSLAEREYSMQHSFENAAKKGLLIAKSLPPDTEKICYSAAICGEIISSGQKFRAGCISGDGRYQIDEPGTMKISLSNAIAELSERNPCITARLFAGNCLLFIGYNESGAKIGLNGDLDFADSMAQCDAGFVLESLVGNNTAISIIAEDVII